MSEDYLWDSSGKPDPDVQRLENLLGRFRHDRPAPELPLPERAPLTQLPRRGFWALLPRLAYAVAIALAATGAWIVTRPPESRPVLMVARVAGAPTVGSEPIGGTGELPLGGVLETDTASRARIDVGIIGEVDVDTNTRMRLVETRLDRHRLALDRGRIHARIWAPPRLFFVDTPSAQVVDLGCAYTLEVDETGAGLVSVTKGWVAFEVNGRTSYIPYGAMGATRPGLGPGTPYYADVSEAFRAALVKLDFELRPPVGGVSGGVFGGVEGVKKARAAALDVVLAESRKQDALSLWHLLSRVEPDERVRVYDGLTRLVPPPQGVTREGVLRGDQQMIDLWWNELGFNTTGWWKKWTAPWPSRPQ